MNPLKLFRSLKTGSHPKPHMTFAGSRVATSISRAGAFVKQRLWIGPVIAVVALTVIGFFVHSAIERTMQANISSTLRTLLDTEVAMLETWFGVQMSNAESAANDQGLRELVYQLLLASEEPVSDETGAVDAEELRRQIARELSSVVASHDLVGYIITDKEQRVIASSSADLVGRDDVREHAGFLTTALAGASTVSAPFPSVRLVKDDDGRMRTGMPTMYVAAPIRDESFQIVGALGLQIRPDRDFTQILSIARLGDSGETYAFNHEGLMVSNSRFDEDLILLGLLPDTEDAQSLLSVQLRDPGGDMTQGYRPSLRVAQRPLTRMAASAVAGNSGIDVDGYRDYRGVPVVGAWKWLDKYNIGVACEIDVAEAYGTLSILEWTFWFLFALLALSAVAILVFTLVVSRMQHDAQLAAIEARQLGQYQLEEKLGAGGMGVVYKARHAMLRRQTAVKLLDVNKVNDASIARFEREVQITCSLEHPSTIAIYDYGRTPEGVFYYAMEFLDGIDLQQLVARYGPQPEGRVIHILQQVCGSLYEAHIKGLVHRDIKPANIMLNRRGAQPDVVKVLDFGLVKALDEAQAAGSTSSGGLTGTPLYMSPEAIQTPLGVDHRSDLYAVGAVGYFLLTGTPVFDADNLVELCRLHVDQVPELPSQRLKRPVSPELENALLACLDKSRAKRPQTARDLAQMLARCPEAGQWSVDAADEWWNRHERNQANPLSSTAPKTADAANERTIIGKPDEM
jgi:serine/threonine protein kinase